MNDINNTNLIGRCVRDAELKYTNSGTAVTKLSIAVNRSKKVGNDWQDEVNFFDIVLWGKTAENLNQYLTKGKLVGISGELRQNRWEQDGQKRSKVEVVAHSIQLLGGKSDGGNAPKSPGKANQANDYPSDFDDSDVPF